MSAVSNQPTSHLPIVNPAKARGIIQLCGMNTNELSSTIRITICINALVIPLFSALIFSTCVGYEHSRDMVIIGTVGQGIGLLPLLILLRLAANHRKELDQTSGPPKFIVDNLHKGIMVSQAINCVVGCLAGSFMITNQCGIGDAASSSEAFPDYQAPGAIILFANVLYLGVTILSGGSKNF